jgi:DNA polymerase-1
VTLEFFTADSETYPIEKGLAAPPLVCVSVYDGKKVELYDKFDGARIVRELILSRVKIGWHNGPYDFCVLGQFDDDLLDLLIEAVDRGQMYDSMYAEQLKAIELGQFKSEWDEEEDRWVKSKFNLGDMIWKYRKRKADKGADGWRLRFGELDGLPISAYPERARAYACQDVIDTHDIITDQGRPVVNEAEQIRAGFALQLMSVWGIRTDAPLVAQVQKDLIEHQQELQKVLLNYKIIRTTGSKNMAVVKAMVKNAYERHGLPVPLTPKGKEAAAAGLPTTDAQISTSRETLEEAADDPILGPDGQPITVMVDGHEVPKTPLGELAELGRIEKVLKSFVPVLNQGIALPINPQFEALAETGRARCRKPNLMNLPRKGQVRECFLARPGFVYCSTDYSALELCTLAQVLIDLGFHSGLAEALNNDLDPHLMVAGTLMQCSYEEAVRRYKAKDKLAADMRQAGKVVNFGLPGGMSAEKLVLFAKAAYKMLISVAQAQFYKDKWFETFPEMYGYFSWVKRQIENGGGEVATALQHRSNRKRGKVWFTQYANTLFQGLGADLAKDALWCVTRECYSVKSSPLYGSRPVVFVHDEIITEMPEDRAEEAAWRQSQILVERGKLWTPDVKLKADPALARRWFKGAEPVWRTPDGAHNDNGIGKLVPWTPEIAKEIALAKKERKAA